MTIEEAIRKNPFDPNKGNTSAYCRYLRYNVEGWYALDSKEVLKRWLRMTIDEAIIALEREPTTKIDESNFSQEQYKADMQCAYDCGRSVMDKVRAEIEEHCGLAKENHCRYCSYCNNVMGVREILEIIDKCEAETEADNADSN